jgi:hypothetical protein
VWSDKRQSIKIDTDRFEALTIPICEDCLQVARPNTLMLGDYNWHHIKSAKQIDKFNIWYDSVVKNNKKIVILELGATTQINAIRSQGEKIAKIYSNAKLIRINETNAQLDEKLGISLSCSVLNALTLLLELTKQKGNIIDANI